jgi:hypothetical protein
LIFSNYSAIIILAIPLGIKGAGMEKRVDSYNEDLLMRLNLSEADVLKP